MPESKKSPESVVTKRFKELLKSCFNNNLKELERACEKVAGEKAPSYGALRKHQSGSMPGLDQAAIIARAAGVSLEWLAGIEKPDPLDESRADREAASPGLDAAIERVRESGYLVKKDERPISEAEFIGGVYRMAGEDIVFIDIVVKGIREERVDLGEIFPRVRTGSSKSKS